VNINLDSFCFYGINGTLRLMANKLFDGNHFSTMPDLSPKIPAEDKKNKPTIPISSKVYTLFQVNQTVVEF
jgi:hypothetical protein